MRPLYQVDAFTDQPFAGNPAAVVLLDRDGDARWMQQVAAEMNLAETAFVWKHETAADADSPHRSGFDSASDSGSDWGLRWFSPAAEVELCGHATLAAAHVLWESGRAAPDEPIHFQTRYRGTLTCRGTWPTSITMTFPADPPRDVAVPAELLEALGLDVSPVHVARGRYDWIVELPTPADVEAYQPDFAALAKVDCRGIALTTLAGPQRSQGPQSLDVISRFFAPRLRIDEDAVTGSLHCVLGPYWSARLGRPTLICRQASPRGGMLIVTTRGDEVDLGGCAVTVARGELIEPS